MTYNSFHKPKKYLHYPTKTRSSAKKYFFNGVCVIVILFLAKLCGIVLNKDF
jgi:hypothetical protein